MLSSGVSGSSLTNETPVSAGRVSSKSVVELSARSQAASAPRPAMPARPRNERLVIAEIRCKLILCVNENWLMARHELIEERLTHSAIGAFYDVYNTLGYGFLEHVYTMALERELLARGHRVCRELWVPVTYDGAELCKQRLDMVVDEKLIIEIKSTLDLPKVASRQLYAYLRATDLSVGLLLHFGAEPRFYRIVGPRTTCIKNGGV